MVQQRVQKKAEMNGRRGRASTAQDSSELITANLEHSNVPLDRTMEHGSCVFVFTCVCSCVSEHTLRGREI